MILFGWGHQKSKNHGPVSKRHCEHCGNDGSWLLCQTSTWFTLFFIPVFPYENKKLLMCPVCASGIPLTAGQFNEYKTTAKNNLMASGTTGAPQMVSQAVSQAVETPKARKGSWLFRIIIIGAVIAGAVQSFIDDAAVNKNNEALRIANEGGQQERSIELLEQAVEQAIDAETKLQTLINLGYSYEDESLAAQTFRKAAELAEIGTPEYHLIGGEIALLEKRHDAALAEFQKAIELRPTDFQINNALGLFYLALDDGAELYADYEKALDYFSQAHASRSPDGFNDENLKENIGLTYFLMEDYDNALDNFLKMNLEDNAVINYFIGLSYANKGNDADAKLYLLKARELGFEISPEIQSYLDSLEGA